MEISINYLLIVIALLFFVVAYFVGIKKTNLDVGWV